MKDTVYCTLLLLITNSQSIFGVIVPYVLFLLSIFKIQVYKITSREKINFIRNNVKNDFCSCYDENGNPIGIKLKSAGNQMGNLWGPNGKPVGTQCESNGNQTGNPMEIQLVSHGGGGTTGACWKTNGNTIGIPIGIHGNPMCSKWQSNGNPLGININMN